MPTAVSVPVVLFLLVARLGRVQLFIGNFFELDHCDGLICGWNGSVV